MPKKSTDIDALIGNDQLEITIGGKTYIVNDVPLQIFLEVSTDAEAGNDPRILHKQLAKLFGVDVSELENIGYRAAAMAIKEIRDWLFEAAGLTTEEAGAMEASSEEQVNP